MDISIAHITTAHPRGDVRIFHKEVVSLSRKYKVYLLVADGNGDENSNNIYIIDIGKFQNRLSRMFLSIFKMLFCVLKTDAKLIHFHDPELLIIVPFLKLFGRKVVYDVHENVHQQILSKTYIPTLIRGVVSRIFFLLESFVCNFLNGIVCSTPAIQRRFNKFSKIVTTINNFPLQNELFRETNQNGNTKKSLVYIGVITVERGINN